MELLRCEGLTRVYGEGEARVTALAGIDLVIERGEFVAVVGASGSGKSTLLHILGSVERATSGSVEVDGVLLAGMSRTQAAIFRRRKVGIVYQFYNLVPDLTIRENILLPLRLDGRKPDKGFFEELTKTLGITQKLDALPGQLSGGQQQRAAIARAMIYRPALLLADEPTGNLDRKNAQEILELLQLSNRRFGQTILLITHDETVALGAKRILTIGDGRILRDEVRG